MSFADLERAFRGRWPVGGADILHERVTLYYDAAEALRSAYPDDSIEAALRLTAQECRRVLTVAALSRWPFRRADVQDP